MSLTPAERETVQRIAYEDTTISTDLEPETLVKKVENLRPRLHELAHREETAPYIEVTDDFSIVHSTRIGSVLGIIGLLEHEQGNPLLPAVVVQANNGWPGRGFNRLLSHAGFEVPEETAEQKEVWRRHLKQVYSHDW